MAKKKTEKPEKAPKRLNVFVSLDAATDAALQRFIEAQRVRPERPAVAFTALVEFLTREGFAPDYGK